jgi:L-amino acid N-acyltransferase YncA
VSYEVVTGHEVGEWVSARIQGFYNPNGSIAFGAMSKGRIVAGILFENFTGASMTCHMASSGRLSAKLLRMASRYAFIQCGIRKLIAPVYDTNSRMLRMAKKMGFREEARLMEVHPGGDILMLTMTKETCRFLGG